MTQIKTMRDALIDEIYHRMSSNEGIFFISGDMGAPALDKIRLDFKERFVNVGIAEQNLINVSTGLALEGFTVYAYAIAPFFMRAYEQIRINLSLSGQLRDVNVNMIGVGCGVSYDVSGPTHHCIEDLIIMRTLPHISVFSPSDCLMAAKFVDFSISKKNAKYIRLDGKPLPVIYNDNTEFNWDIGFHELIKGNDICLISTGYMTHQALDVAKSLELKGIKVGVIDVFLLDSVNLDLLYDAVKNYNKLLTIEEGFINKGGLDALVLAMLNWKKSKIHVSQFGFFDKYMFSFGDREQLYKQNMFDRQSLVNAVLDCCS